MMHGWPSTRTSPWNTRAFLPFGWACPWEVMMAQRLASKKVAILATDGVEQIELTEPMKALRDEGAIVEVVSPRRGEIQAMNHAEKGDRISVDVMLDEARPASYDALVLPGGVANPDRLRTDEQAVAFARHFHDTKKPIAVICHGPWTLIDAGVVKGRTLTSWPSLRTDLVNAGARWINRDVVVDQGIVSSRKPDDLAAFCEKMVAEFAEAGYRAHRAAE
jgi:protease I